MARRGVAKRPDILDFFGNTVISRRSFFKGAAIAVGGPMINRGKFSLFASSKAEYSARAIDLVRSSTVIDMLGLVTFDFKKLWAWQRASLQFKPEDFERLKASGINVFHPAVGYSSGDIYGQSLQDICLWNAFIKANEKY